MMTQTVAKRSPQKLPKTTFADAATDQLRKLIISGDIPDGTPLRQDTLAEELGVSRIPIREALARLESEGLAASEPHKGYYVTALSKQEIQELFDLRLLLEPELIGLAIPNMREEDFRLAEEILSHYAIGLDNADIWSWGDLNTRYHMALYAPSGRKRTIEIVRSLLSNTDRYTRLVLTLDEGPEHAKEDHAGLLDLCRKGLVNQAMAATRDHILRASNNMLSILKSGT